MILNDKTILTDCDGVLLDWQLAFHEWMISKGYVQQATAVYDISIMYGITKVEGKRLVREFNESAWMGFLPALRDARSGVAKLVENGYQFLVITSLSLDEKAKMLRVSNLKNIFGKNVFIDVICLDTGADKDEALAPYKDSGLFWIEDKTENAQCGDKLGLKSIIITHDHNQDCKDVTIKRCQDWNDIADYIITEGQI